MSSPMSKYRSADNSSRSQEWSGDFADRAARARLELVMDAVETVSSVQEVDTNAKLATTVISHTTSLEGPADPTTQVTEAADRQQRESAALRDIEGIWEEAA